MELGARGLGDVWRGEDAPSCGSRKHQACTGQKNRCDCVRDRCVWPRDCCAGRKYCCVCPRCDRERANDAARRLHALARAPVVDAFGRKVGRGRFVGMRCHPILSRFDKMWSRRRPRSSRSCRMPSRFDFRCATIVLGRSVVTQYARASVRGARSGPRDGALGPNMDAIASEEHAMASREHAWGLPPRSPRKRLARRDQSLSRREICLSPPTYGVEQGSGIEADRIRCR